MIAALFVFLKAHWLLLVIVLIILAIIFVALFLYLIFLGLMDYVNGVGKLEEQEEMRQKGAESHVHTSD